MYKIDLDHHVCKWVEEKYMDHWIEWHDHLYVLYDKGDNDLIESHLTEEPKFRPRVSRITMD